VRLRESGEKLAQGIRKDGKKEKGFKGANMREENNFPTSQQQEKKGSKGRLTKSGMLKKIYQMGGTEIGV